MEDIIDIIVTETTNTIEITAQPNDEIIDVNIIDNREDIVLNVTPTVVEININSLTSNFGVEWGDITGTLADQTDLNNALALKANLVGGKVPASELPSYVDDVVEVANFAALPATGETGKIYITLDNNKIYRWSGSVYVEIADSTAVWGAITGTLSSQTDLQSALDAKLSVTTAASTYVPYTGATGDVNLGVNVLKSNNVILDGDTSATGYLGFKQFSGAQGGGLGYSSISATGLTKFYFRAYQTGADVKSFNFDLASLTNLTERNYTLPDANGTLALTSNLTAYVPYTGATANVDLGTHTIIASKGTFSSSGSPDTVGITHSSGSGIALNITKGGNGEGIYVNKSSGSGNAVTIVGTLNATTLVKNGGTSSQFLKADGSIDSSVYALDSAVVKLAGTQTITGNKGFTVAPTFDSGAGFKNPSGLYNYISATDTGWKMPVNFNKEHIFVLNTSTAYTYTFPSATGTLALTSDLSAYLPLAGGTLTGALNGTSAVFSSSVTSSGYYLTGMTSGSGALYYSSGANRVTVANYNTNGIILFEVNGGNTALTLNANLSATFAGAISGTSASFSNDISVNSISIGLGGGAIATNTRVGLVALSANTIGANNTGMGVFSLQNNTTSSNNTAYGAATLRNIISGSENNTAIGSSAGRYIADRTTTLTISNNSIFLGSFTKALANNQTNQIVIGHNAIGLGSNTTVLGNSSTTITALYGNVGIGTTAPDAQLVINGASNSRFNMRAGDTRYATLYADNGVFAVASITSIPLVLGTNDTERMRITSGGNVGIGDTGSGITRLSVTSSDSGSSNYALAINNTSGGLLAIRNDGYVFIQSNTLVMTCGTGTYDGMWIQNTSNNTSATAIRFKGWNDTTTGSIATYVNLTTYNTSSDYRLKEDLKQFSGLDLVSKLKMYDFKWKEADWRMYGGLAHEIQEVLPYAVTGTKDGNDTQGVDYSTIVPLLIQSIKELKSKIETLENK
jgi:hypothetical protein